MINYLYSYEKSNDFIKDVLYIDSIVYAKEHQGTYDSVNNRYLKNKESYVLAYCGNKLVGYICFFPIKNDIYKDIITNGQVYDDNIIPDNITEYTFEEKLNIFIISVAVLPDYQNKGIGKELMSRMLFFLDIKIQKGHIIERILGETISYMGRVLLSAFNFKNTNNISENIDLYEYQYNDFLDTCIYGFVPCSKISNDFIYDNTKKDSNFLETLNNISKLELNENFITKVTRFELDEDVKLIVHSDTNNEVLFIVPIKMYVTSYYNLSSLLIQIEHINFDPSIILDQFSSGIISLMLNNQNIDFNSFLNKYNLIRNGEIKALITDYKDFTINHKACMLAAEQFVRGYVSDYQIISDELIKKAKTSIGNYSFSEIYASKKTIIYILSSAINPAERVYYESLIIYIIELLCMQINIISYSNAIVLNTLENNLFSEDISRKIDKETAKTTLIWDEDIYRYYLAQKLAKYIADEYQIKELKEKYINNHNLYLSIKQNHEFIRMARINQTSKKYFSIFTLLSCFTTLNTLIGLVFSCFVKDTFLKSIIVLIVGTISIGCFMTFLFINKQRSKKILMEEYNYKD